MTSKSASLSILSLIAAVFLISFASAAVLDVSGVTYASTASHSSDVAVTFNVAYSGSVNSTTVNFNESYTNVGSWKSLPSATAILNNSIPVSFSAVLSIPRYAGTVSAVLRTKGTTTVDTPITITVPSAPSIAVYNVQSMTKTQNATINVTNTGNANLGNVVLSSSGAFNVSFSINNFGLAAGNSILVNVNALENLNDVKLGHHSTTVTAKDSITNASNAISYSVTGDFCSKGNVNVSKIDITNIDDTSSDTAWNWKPLDDVTVEVDISNNLDRDEDFVVALGIYDTLKNKYLQIDEENTIEQTISINKDDSDTASFDFQVPADIGDEEGRYVLYVKAYVDGKEGTYCNSYSAIDTPDSDAEDIVIDKNTHDITLSDLSEPEMVRAGDTVTVSATAFNIGTSNEKKVKVILTNSKLGLSTESSTFDMDTGDSNSVDFSFVVPYTAVSGVYSLGLTSYFDYKKSSDTYSDRSDPFYVKLTVVGGIANNTQTGTSAGIAAVLNSDAKAGGQMDVTATIKNLGSNRSTFIVGVINYESWASLNSISDRILTLDAGESRDIKVSFDVSPNATGEQTFKIESRSGDRIDTKEVAVTIAGSGSIFSSLADSLKSKTILWVIGIVNLILIILIIVLAVRIFRR